MSLDFQGDFNWQRRFIPHLKAIMAQHLIAEAPFEDDALRATDLLVLNLRDVRVACRVRRNHYLARYGDEFTIRCDRPSGVETEFSKLVSGFGDYLIYGFSDERETGLASWVLGDLMVWRNWVQKQTYQHGREGLERYRKPNTDGTQFFAFPLSALPDDFVVARGRPGELAVAA